MLPTALAPCLAVGGRADIPPKPSLLEMGVVGDSMGMGVRVHVVCGPISDTPVTFPVQDPYQLETERGHPPPPPRCAPVGKGGFW